MNEIAIKDSVRVNIPNLYTGLAKVVDYDKELQEYAVQYKTTWIKQTVWVNKNEIVRKDI